MDYKKMISVFRTYDAALSEAARRNDRTSLRGLRLSIEKNKDGDFVLYELREPPKKNYV